MIGIAAAIASLSIAVAPAEAKNNGLAFLAIGLGGLGIAGGVVYLAEKLINLAKGVSLMIAELIVEKYKQRRWEAGRREGLQEGRQEGRREGRQEWRAWYERQQAALREGRPFTEPPPGYSHDAQDPSKESA